MQCSGGGAATPVSTGAEAAVEKAGEVVERARHMAAEAPRCGLGLWLVDTWVKT